MYWSDISHTFHVVTCVTNYTTCDGARAGLRIWQTRQVAADRAGSGVFKLKTNRKYQNLCFTGYNGDNSQSPHSTTAGMDTAAGSHTFGVAAQHGVYKIMPFP